MRVLWLSPFSGNQASGATGGWVSALADALGRHSTVELSIAVRSSALRLGKTTNPEGRVHYVLPESNRSQSRPGQIARRQLCRLDRVRRRDLIEVVSDARPDLIHVFGTESVLGSVQEIADLPVLISLQGNLTTFVRCFFGSFGRLDVLRYGQKRRLIAGTSLLHRYGRYIRGAARERRILSEARYVTGRTDWDREIANQWAPRALYFGCDEVLRDEFRATERQPPTGSEPTQILTTIRSNPYKGLEVVLQAANRLSKQGLRFNWKVAGIRPDEEIAVICRRKFGLRFRENSVQLLGSQSAPSLAGLLARSDVYVHPSWIDNSPNALCEAMVSGVPVVSTGVGGIPSLLTSGREGLIVPAGDIDALVNAIQELLAKPEWTARLAGNARRRAEARHDPARISRVLTDIYGEILSPASAHAGTKECRS